MSNMWSVYYCLIKNNLIKQTRSYSFLIVVLLTLFLGYACVPSPSSGYQVFYIGGVRGIYNSAWLGGMVTMMSTLLIWLFAFFMLRSQISEDQRLKVGQIIAATPVTNFRYIIGKAISNYVVLLVIELILFLAFMGMQLIRGEDYYIRFADYWQPFVFIVMPSLFVLAALTVLFDVVPGLKGVVGNMIFFAIWVFFSIVSIATPNSSLDVFGLDIIRSDMVQEAMKEYSFLSTSEEGGSFGYYPVEGNSPTFVWQGVDWNSSLLIDRLIWVGVALLIILISSLVFNRFRMKDNSKRSYVPVIYEPKKGIAVKSAKSHDFTLSPVKKEKGVRIARIIRAEMYIMLKDCSIWWYLLVLGSMAASLLIPLEKVLSWLPVLALWPIAIWSQMGTREKYYFTRDLLLSSCPPLKRFLAVWIAGILITLLVFSGALVHFALDGQWTLLTAWLVSVLFIPTLAMALGTLSGSRKMFEVVYILWWYMGAVNDLPYLNFLGGETNHSLLYGILAGILLIAALIGQQIKAGVLTAGGASKSKSKQYYKGGVS
ncbi:ABC transporter permease [Paenibacillus ihumii]|uniref:ABC transporter permease n=1 Tax=Paenibacillus ihumii TaxID=687436 RepID=UPI0006D84E05|nr:ABC transporter permease [Paenibacillus ihumii]